MWGIRRPKVRLMFTVATAIAATTISVLISAPATQAAAKKKVVKKAAPKPAAAPGKLAVGAFGANVAVGNYAQLVGAVMLGLTIGKDDSLEGALPASGPTNVLLRIRQSQISILHKAIVQIDPLARISNGTEQPFPADYAAYLRTIPGVTATVSDVKIGGTAAQRIEFSIAAKPSTGNPTYLLETLRISRDREISTEWLPACRANQSMGLLSNRPWDHPGVQGVGPVGKRTYAASPNALTGMERTVSL